jgi:hypothetical protein
MILLMEKGRAENYSGMLCPDSQVEIPDGVTQIGSRAFFRMRDHNVSDNPRYRSIHIPDRVREIAAEAFYRCEALESVRLPSGLLRIESGASGSAAACAKSSCRTPSGR